jgi:phosphoribosylaminoimidazolecarboxamide formyltransferase/IMP cyclohydrolase
MAEDKKISRSTYLTKNVGEFEDTVTFGSLTYRKCEDLRYGTNPHQTAAFYVPVSANTPIGDMQILKTGKSGLSQTNLEDISYALNICKYFDRPACACMKHVNPSGAAVGTQGENLTDVYRKARDCDARAAFGCVTAFNTTVDAETATEIMSTFVECVVAPDFTPEALAIFNDNETFKLNKSIRILKCGDLSQLPKYMDDNAAQMWT